MYKKVCCKCKVVVLPMFSLPIVLLDYKVPNRNCGTYMCQEMITKIKEIIIHKSECFVLWLFHGNQTAV